MCIAKCSCGNIYLQLSHTPKSIARCYCSICQSIHHEPFSSFCEYQQGDVQIISPKDSLIGLYSSSNRAHRAFCLQCNDWIFMQWMTFKINETQLHD